ncbi:MAG: hypothetical protein JST26_05465 [Bacteroidetes bacterium]|nr:hypothetical protein [Bacteroidota bacterium]
MESKQITFYHSTFWLQDGILFSKLKRDLIDLKIAMDIVQDRKRVFGKINMPFFIELGSELPYVNADVRRYFASRDAWDYITAGALVTTNKLNEFLGNAWLILDKPVVPIKIFTNRKSALEWLELYKPLTR